MKKEALKRLAIAVCGLVLAFWCASAYGQDDYEAEGWEFYFTPYLWLPSMDVESTVSGITTDIDLSFGDIIDKFSIFGLAGRFEVWNGCLGFILDGMYFRARGDSKTTAPVANIATDVFLEQGWLQGNFSYRTPDLPLTTRGKWPSVRLEPYLGLRWNELTQEIDVSLAGLGPLGLRRTAKLGGSKTYLDPLLGVRIPFRLIKQLTFAIRGDVGVFGAGSDLAWTALVGIDYRPWQLASFKLGYQWYGVDYETGSGRDKFGFEGIMQGPWLGFTLNF